MDDDLFSDDDLFLEQPVEVSGLLASICNEDPDFVLMDMDEEADVINIASGGVADIANAEDEEDTLMGSSDTCISDTDSEVSEERLKVMGQLEELSISVLEKLAAVIIEDNDKKAKKTKRIIVQLADRKRTLPDGSMATRTIMFPRKARGASIQPLAQLFRVVSLVYEALQSDVPMTKRDMYYKDVELFKSQAVVDRLVDDLAATLGVGRADLHVRASSKGLVCGSRLTIHLKGGETVEVNDSEGTLIPAGEDIAHFDVDEQLAWVLVVEKEAVFQTLCRLNVANHTALTGPGLVITGKGYPDVATRQLVRTLSDNLPPHIPILALVDGDAFGLDILSVYRFGSTQMQHERESLAAPRIRWLGLRTSELAGLGVPKDVLIPISKHDEKKALSMLRRSGLPNQWRKELQYMLHNRRKAEIEVLASVQKKVSVLQDGLHGRLVGNNTGSMDETSDLLAMSERPKPTEPPSLVTYLVDNINAIVDAYDEKYL